MKKVVEPVIRMEFETQTNTFLTRIKEALSKG